MAVSYTHLDVYKRQMLVSAIIGVVITILLGMGLATLLRLPKNRWGVFAAMVGVSNTPVSYTHLIIGRRGETLDAIQQLTNYSVNHGQSKRVRIHVDAEGYRAKREESLQRLAVKVAGKVVKYRKNVTLEPMNAYERHVIHTALQDHPNVTTYSTAVSYTHLDVYKRQDLNGLALHQNLPLSLPSAAPAAPYRRNSPPPRRAG